MNDLEIFINGNVPSSKNGKRWTGKYLIHSKTTMRYIKESKGEYLEHTYPFKEFIKRFDTPYTIHFKFYRKSRRKFDYVNPLQTVQDLMVKYQCWKMTALTTSYLYLIHMNITRTNQEY